jgi:hypothetical protein
VTAAEARALTDRLDRLERAVGQLAREFHGVAGGAKLAMKYPELGAVLNAYERAGAVRQVGVR